MFLECAHCVPQNYSATLSFDDSKYHVPGMCSLCTIELFCDNFANFYTFDQSMIAGHTMNLLESVDSMVKILADGPLSVGSKGDKKMHLLRKWLNGCH